MFPEKPEPGLRSLKAGAAEQGPGSRIAYARGVTMQAWIRGPRIGLVSRQEGQLPTSLVTLGSGSDMVTHVAPYPSISFPALAPLSSSRPLCQSSGNSPCWEKQPLGMPAAAYLGDLLAPQLKCPLRPGEDLLPRYLPHAGRRKQRKG